MEISSKPCYNVILFYKTLNLQPKLILISITMKQSKLIFLFRCQHCELQTHALKVFVSTRRKIYL